MDTLLGILFFLSLLAFIFFLILLIVKLVFKKGMALNKILTVVGASIIIMILSLVFAPELTEEQKARIAERNEQRELEKQEKEEQKALEKKKKEEEKKEEELEREKEEEQKEEEKQKALEREKKEAEKKGEKPETEKEEEKQEKSKTEKEQEDKRKDKTENKQEQPEDKSKESEEEEKEDVKSAEQKSNKKVNFSNAKKPEDFSKLLKEKNDDIESVAIKDEIAVITYRETVSWSETSAFKDFAIDSTSIMRELEDNNEISGIGFAKRMTMIDKEGNESVDDAIIAYYDKENYDDINFENFVNQVYADSSNFYKVSNGYWFHPGVYQSIDSDALNGLPFTATDTSEGFETFHNALD